MSSQDRQENSVSVCHCFASSTRLTLNYFPGLKDFGALVGLTLCPLWSLPDLNKLKCVMAENPLGIFGTREGTLTRIRNLKQDGTSDASG